MFSFCSVNCECISCHHCGVSTYKHLLREQGKFRIPEELVSPRIAPQIEARYKLVNRLLVESSAQQVLEIATGLSPRGLAMTRDPNVVYVEVDLPDIMSQKRKIARALGLGGNLHLETGNALDLGSLRAAVAVLDPTKPLAIVHEGLLRYFSFDEKTIVARNIRALLERFGGAWITPDITLRTALKTASADDRRQMEQVGQLVKINIDQNRFEDVDAAHKFFEDLAFSVERHRFTEVMDELVSPDRLCQTRGEVEALIGEAHVFVMRVRQ